jgi:sugar-specific transcriptional regulator TrmB
MERLESILADLGMDESMARVFAYLADKKRSTMEDIYYHTTLSRGVISMALGELVSGGIVRREGEYFTVEDVQKALLAMLPSRFEELKAEIYSYAPPPKRESCAVVETTREEEEAMPSLLARNMDAALESVDVISRSLFWLDDGSLDSARAAIQRGVIVRVIAFKYPELAPDARALADAGVEVRMHEYAADTNFFIVDGKFVAFFIKEPPQVTRPACLRLMIRDKKACEEILRHVFNPTWENAEVVEEIRI